MYENDPGGMTSALNNLAYHAAQASRHAIQLEDRRWTKGDMSWVIDQLRRDMTLMKHYLDYCAATLADDAAPVQQEAAE